MRVVVAGALGVMGRETCAAIDDAPDLELVGGFARANVGESLADVLGLSAPAGIIYDDVATCYEATKPDIVVDFTVYPVSLDVAREAVERDISPVIGATGWTDEDRVSFESLCDERACGAAIVPNFALGAVLMMRFAAAAAAYFPRGEIVEFHHDRKRDRPSGTARLTARRVAAVTGESPPIHSVRLPGLIAHQEVIFGGDGETLTIRHDSLTRRSFRAGILLAARGVRTLERAVVGLEPFLPVVA